MTKFEMAIVQQLPRLAKEWSDDVEHKVSCVIIKGGITLSMAANSLPERVQKWPNRIKRPEKYAYIGHAEENAIAIASKNGEKLDGATLIMKWFPCNVCARMIINSGISRLICNTPDLNSDNKYNFSISWKMLKEANIEIEYIPEELL